MSDLSKKTNRRILIVILLSLLVPIFVVTVLWYTVIVPFVHEVRCKGNLVDIALDIVENHNLLYIKDVPYYKDELVVSRSFDNKMLICSACKKPYIYSPVAPSGERIWIESPVRTVYFIMWCPEPCRKRRAFLAASASAWVATDDQVSWYYQKFAEDLSQEEFRIEYEHRLSQGMKSLKKKPE